MFSASSSTPAESSSWFLKPGKNLVIEKEENASEEEKAAHAVWKSILVRKGLPLTTPYQYVPKWPKDDEEKHCDMLFVKAKQRREAEGLSAFAAALEADENAPNPPINKSPFVYQTGFAFDFNDRMPDKMRQKSINGIVYQDPQLFNKKKLLVQDSIRAMPKYREARAAKRLEEASKAIYYYY